MYRYSFEIMMTYDEYTNQYSPLPACRDRVFWEFCLFQMDPNVARKNVGMFPVWVRFIGYS